jgi:large subunit ribosomal protein L15
VVTEKTKKLRGGSYGRGHKAGRGKGKRGGKGMAGLGKHRWIWMVKYMPDHYGGHGFVRHAQKSDVRAINIGDLDRTSEKLVETGMAHVEEDKIRVDLEKMGYAVLLGGGQVGRPFIIKVGRATEKAIEKVKSAGGEVETNGGDKEE